jgi:hypothetical protein
VADRHAAYVPVGHESGDTGFGHAGFGGLLGAASRADQLELTTVLERLKPLLEDAGVRKLGHDLKQETILLGRQGVTIRGVEFDAMLGSYLLDANRSSHGLPGDRSRAPWLPGDRSGERGWKGMKAVPPAAVARRGAEARVRARGRGAAARASWRCCSRPSNSRR